MFAVPVPGAVPGSLAGKFVTFTALPLFCSRQLRVTTLRY